MEMIEQNYNQILHGIKANIKIVVNHNFTNVATKGHVSVQGKFGSHLLQITTPHLHSEVVLGRKNHHICLYMEA